MISPLKLLPLLLLPALQACSPKEAPIDTDLQYCDKQVHRTLEELRQPDGQIDYTMSPRNILQGEQHWNLRKVDKTEWCGGFFPGILWYDYEATGDTAIERQARNFTEPLAFLAKTPVFDHDLGFLVITSFLNGWKLTQNEHYRQILLDCADSLATLYNPCVGTLLSWPRHKSEFGGHNTIMDNMINLELLFWASQNGGPDSLAEIACHHADTTMRYHFRPDYTSYHVALYDTIDGHFIKAFTHQGLADSSMWARGQAWAIYGYTMCYRYTQNPKYLDFAQKVTDVYLARLPKDGVPFWDFDDPRIPTSGNELTPSETVAPRDASAACIVASALIELASYLPVDKANLYRDAARNTLNTLREDRWRGGKYCPAFLLHCTGHHPAGSEIDASISYGDYYYIEALLRAKKTGI